MPLSALGFEIKRFYLDENYSLNVDFTNLDGGQVTAYWYSFGEQWLLASEGETEGVPVQDFFDQTHLNVDLVTFEKALRDLFNHIKSFLATEITPLFATVSPHEAAKAL